MAETRIIRPHKGFQEKFVRTNVDVCIAGGVLNCGKAQPLDSKVLTPQGFVRMGDLKAGDFISASDGGIQRVLRVFERGVLDTYLISFDDGTTVECCPEHLWTVWDEKMGKYKTIEAQEVKKHINRYSIDLPKRIALSNEFIDRLSEQDYYRSLGYKVCCKDGIIHSSKDRKRFESIKLIDKKEMRCILVSSDDHLYITDNFTLTHNTTGAVLMCAEPSLDPYWRAVFLRNNLGDLRSGGGILDEFKNVYGKSVSVTESGEPHVDFIESGARVDVTHIADQSRDKVRQRFKGRQYDLIYFDEMTGFSWECFTEVCTRNRGRGKWTGKIRGTTNPDRNHWLRTFLDWYIGLDGFIREDRDGVVRYFYMAGETVKDVVWGDTKEEVYNKCRIQIDRQLSKINGKTGRATYKDLIRSFTFYLGRMSENVDSIDNNSGYVGAVAMSGGRNAEQLLEGNWNVSPEDKLDTAITSEMASQILMNDPQTNGDKWVTADLADVGEDNFVCLAWDGFHVTDSLILCQTTPRENAERLEIFAAEHGVSNSHIIYDGTRALYINDYIPEARAFISSFKPFGMYARTAMRLKDECYLRLVQMIKKRMISISEDVANRVYEHRHNKSKITFANEFIEECLVVAFKEVQSGKNALLTKREMNQKLGKGRSMDVLDPFAMRMLPVLEYPYGSELEQAMQYFGNSREDSHGDFDIYDDSNWC